MTHSRRLSMARLVKKRHGSTGSIVVLWLVIYRSHSNRSTHSSPDIESKLITYADFQGKRESASSNPAVIDNVASSSRAAPIMSTFALDPLENFSPQVVL